MYKFSTILNNSKIHKLKTFQLKKIFIAMIFISIGIIACGISCIIQNDLLFGIVWVCIGVLYIPLVFLFNKYSGNKDLTYKYIKHPDLIENYTFDENGVTIEQTNNKDYNFKNYFPYFNFYKFYKTKTDYFLYFNKDHVHILPIEDFNGDDIIKFEELIKSKIGKKFKKTLF